MKNNLSRLFLLVALLFLSFSAFPLGGPPPPPPPEPCPECPPGTDDNNGGLEGDDLPIDGKVLWLAISGIAFAFYVSKKNFNSKVTE